MTDEELGRIEAARLGDKKPETYSGVPGWFGHSMTGWPIECDDIPMAIWNCLTGGCPSETETKMRHYESESEAYAALGIAVRAVRAACGWDEIEAEVRRLTQERDAALDSLNATEIERRSAVEDLRDERGRREKAEAELRALKPAAGVRQSGDGEVESNS